MLRRVLSPLRLVHRQLALKHLSKSFLNGNGTCNSIAINVYTYLLAYFSFFFRCFKSACKEPECASSDFLCSKLFLFFSFSPLRKKASNVEWIKIKGKIAFNAAEKKHQRRSALNRGERTNGDFEKCDHLHEFGQSERRRIKWFLFHRLTQRAFSVWPFFMLHTSISASAQEEDNLMSYDVDVSVFFSPFVIKQKKVISKYETSSRGLNFWFSSPFDIFFVLSNINIICDDVKWSGPRRSVDAFCCGFVEHENPICWLSHRIEL